jgi:hypothetical protein
MKEQLMSTRGEDLATRFTELSDTVVAEIDHLDSSDLAKVSEPEQWTVAALACHIANVYGGQADWTGLIVSDQPLPEITMADIDAMNAAEAARNARASKDEVLTRLRTNGDRMRSVLIGLSDADTERPVSFSLLNWQQVSLGDLIGMGLIEHIQEHLASIRATVEG